MTSRPAVAARCLADADLDAHLARVGAAYRERRDALLPTAVR